MARRRKPRDTRMGVGGVAGDLEYGERGVVESTAMAPGQPGGAVTGPQGPPPQGGPMLGAAVEPFAPTDRPDQPITAGLEPDAMMSPNPTDILAAMYRRFPYPDLRRLLERAQMTDYNAMARQESAGPPMGGMGMPAGGMEPMGGMPQSPDDPMTDSWMRDDDIGGRIEGFDPDRSTLSPEEQADVERRMDDVRRDRTGGRF